MSRYEAVPHPRDPKLVYYRKVKGAGEPQVVPVKKSSRQNASSVVPVKKPPRKSASGVVPAKRPKGEKRVVPAVRPANPGKVVPVFRRKTEIELKDPATAEWQQYGAANYHEPLPDNLSNRNYFGNIQNLSVGGGHFTFPNVAKRGVDYPDDYYGFVKASSIYVEAFCSRPPRRTQIMPAIKLVFGNLGIESAPFPLVYDSYRKCRTAQIVFFSEDGQAGNRNLDKIPWPNNHLATDLLDGVKIQLATGGPQMIRQVKITLNRESILDVFWNHPRTIREHIGLDLTDFIRDHRMQRLRHTADYFGDSRIYHNPVLRQAALEWGKSWNPKYGGQWHKKEGGAWKNWPEEWCSEFASWVIRHATNLNSPDWVCDSVSMARYFIGRQKNSDLLNHNRFITPNNEICLWEWNEDEEKNLFDGYGLEPDNWPQEYIDERNEFHQQRKRWLTYYDPDNRQQCNWASLKTTVKPGYYVKLKRGKRGDEVEGHSTLFVAWQHSIRKNYNPLDLNSWGEDELRPGFKREKSTNFFTGLGGNQDNIVRLKSYSISKRDNDAHIFWRAQEDAVGWGGYQDGFGITTDLAQRVRSRRNVEIK